MRMGGDTWILRRSGDGMSGKSFKKWLKTVFENNPTELDGEGVPRVSCQPRQGFFPVSQRNNIQPGDPRLRLVEPRRLPQGGRLLLPQRRVLLRRQGELSLCDELINTIPSPLMNLNRG